MAATQLGVKTEQLIRWDASFDNGNGTFGAYVLKPIPRTANYIAATGKTFDYRLAVAAYNADGTTVDTTFTGTVTATVTTGTCTLGGTVSRSAVSGIADFSDLYPATGTGSLAITFSATGLTSYATPVMTVVAPQYDAYALTLGLFVEQPRLAVDTTYPASFVNEYTLNPGAAPSATNVQTWAAAIAKVVSDNAVGATRFKVTPGTYTEKITLAVKSNTGDVVFEPAIGIPGTAGTRVSPTDFATNAVIVKHSDLVGTVQCSGAAHHYRFSGIAFTKVYSATSETHNAIVSINNQNFEADASATLDIDDFPSDIGFDRCYFYGLANYTTRKGIFAEGRRLFVTNSYFDEIHATNDAAHGGLAGAPDTGSGDEQAISIVGAPGPVLVENNALRAAGEVILIGGGNPWFYDMKPRDLIVRRNAIVAPLAWEGTYKHKNNTELKSVGRIWFTGNVHEGAWDDKQDGTGLQFASANQAYDKPYAANYSFEGIEDVIVEASFGRSMQTFMALTGAAAPSSTPARRCSVHDNVGVHLNDPATWHLTGASNGNRAVFLGGLTDVAWGHNTLLASPDATPTSALLMQRSDTLPSPTTYYRDNVTVAARPGTKVDGGAGGTPGYVVAMPDDPNPRGNVFYGFDNSYPYNYDLPTDLIPNVAADLAAVGFTDVSGIASFGTMDPETIVAGLALTAGSTYKGAASDSTDPGADIAAVSTAIADVWDSGFAAADHLAITTEPNATTVSGVVHATQPAGVVQDGINATVTSDTSTVTAEWVTETGSGTAIGTLTAVCVAGVWAFTDLGVTSTLGCTGHWSFTDGSLTSVVSATITILAAGVPVTSALPAVIDQWRPPATREGLKVIVSPSPLIGTGGLVAVASNTVSVHIPVGRIAVSVLSLALDAMVAAAGGGTITVQVFKVTAAGVATALTAATSIKNDVVTVAGNLDLPMASSVFDGPANGSRRIDGTRGEFIRVDIVASSTITTQPQLRVVAELAVTG